MFGKSMSAIRLFTFGLILSSVFISNGYAQSSGNNFPRVAMTRDYDEMLSDYSAYLGFVLRIGNQVDNASARRLSQNYTKLRKHYPEGAAKFLKGLRFELVHKLELMGAAPEGVSVQHPEMRRFVRASLSQWSREADEYLFRAYATQIARKD